MFQSRKKDILKVQAKCYGSQSKIKGILRWTWKEYLGTMEFEMSLGRRGEGLKAGYSM